MLDLQHISYGSDNDGTFLNWEDMVILILWRVSCFLSSSLPLLVRLKIQCRRPGPLARLGSRLPGPGVAWIARGAGRTEIGRVSVLYRLKLPWMPNCRLFWTYSIIHSMLTRAGAPWGLNESIMWAAAVHNTVLSCHCVSSNVTVWIKVMLLLFIKVMFKIPWVKVVF